MFRLAGKEENEKKKNAQTVLRLKARLGIRGLIDYVIPIMVSFGNFFKICPGTSLEITSEISL